MSTKERILRLVREEPPAPAALPRRAVSRRALYRVDTRTMGLDASIQAGVATAGGELLNVSAAGCCVRVAAPLPAPLDPGNTASVTMHREGAALTCRAEVVSLAPDTNGAGVEVRLRFCALPPQTQRALLAWVSALVTEGFRQRHTTAISD